MSNAEARISQPINESSYVEQGETSQVNNIENPKEQEAIPTPQYSCLNGLEGCFIEGMKFVTWLEISQRK